MSEKVIVVTGASQGIGAALVKGFRAQGHRVVANSRKLQPVNDPNILSVVGDIADPAVADRLVAATLERWGRIDTLVNNAGIFIGKPFVDYTAEDFANVMSTNVAGFFYVTQRVARQMLRQGNGHIVNVTTSLVDQPIGAVPTGLAALSKGGLASITKSLATEYAAKGIRVNAVSPGIIKTPMNEGEDRNFLAKLQPMGRLGETEEIVDAVLYLDRAAFVTGEIIHVDGGAHAGQWQIAS
ncbi:MAG: SDR family oxidoreductase [Proteobacteria bacterium]|nr:SDR family oxidoreductase [Pseudomonadota bacterium]